MWYPLGESIESGVSLLHHWRFIWAKEINQIKNFLLQTTNFDLMTLS